MNRHMWPVWLGQLQAGFWGGLGDARVPEGLKCIPPSRDLMLISHHLAQGFSRFTSKYNALTSTSLYLQKEKRFRVPLGPVGWDLMAG